MPKRSKNRKLSRQGKIAVQAAALGLCVLGGSLILPKVGYTFQPAFAFSNVLRQNQIIFPDQEKQSSLLGNGDGASDALTEDKTADEARRPDANAGNQDSIQLDGTVPDGAVLPDGAIAPDDGASTGGTGGIAFLPGGSGGDGTIVIPGGQIIPLPDKDGDGTGGTGGGSVPSSPSDPGSVTPGGGGGSDGGMGWLPVDVTPGYYLDAYMLRQLAEHPQQVQRTVSLSEDDARIRITALTLLPGKA